ncbi:antigen peptide transporter 2a [Antennarius striatus]|uniref:antigen peptide transporter 2a n=1 Tax=Antennarius striatus TaxID=241820 RepID=UPI0035B11068
MICKVVLLALAVGVDVLLFYSWGAVAAHSVNGYLLRVWLCAALRCLAPLCVALLSLGDMNPLLTRFITAHGLLPAVVETGTATLFGGETPCASPTDLRCWIIYAGASSAAALFWEITFPDNDEEAAGKEKKQKARELFVRVLHMYKPHCHLLLGGLVFLFVAVGFEMAVPFYTGRVIDILGGQYPSDEFTSAVLCMGLYCLGSSLSGGSRGAFLFCAIHAFIHGVKIKLFGALTKQEVGFFEMTKIGEITFRLSENTKTMGRTVCLNINVLLRTIIKTLGVIYFMMALQWKLTFLVLLETPIIVLIQKIHDKHHQRLSLAVQDAMALANDAAKEAVSGIRVVRSFRAEKHEAHRYDDRLTNIHTLKFRQSTVTIVYLLIRRLTGLCMQVFILYYGRLFIQSGQMTTGSLVSFILYHSDFADNIRAIIYHFGDMFTSVWAAGKVFEYLDRKPQISADGKLNPDRLIGNVSFRHVNFAYPTQPNKPVLQDFSLELKSGHMTALLGSSGEGKSTCASLLKRLYEPQDGEILLDDKPVASYEPRFLRTKIALVNQDPVLFTGSVRDNIAYGLAHCSLAEIQEAARKANADDFIQMWENGYDTKLGEGVRQLSRSEKQRIGIARALIRRPQVLILDEITSSLDTDNENKVQQALADCPNLTLLVITHKPMSIEKADQIVVIGEGKVQERGTHQELMDRKGSYYKMRDKIFAWGNSPQRSDDAVASC